MPEERNDDRQHSHHGYDYYKGMRISSISPKRQKRGNCLHKGVYYRPKRKVWEAQIQISGEKQWLGYFKTFEDAVKAREEAEEKYFKPILDVRPPKEKRKEKLPGKNVSGNWGSSGPFFQWYPHHHKEDEEDDISAHREAEGDGGLRRFAQLCRDPGEIRHRPQPGQIPEREEEPHRKGERSR